MKELLCILLLSLPLFAFSQEAVPNIPTDESTGKILYTEVVQVDSILSKEELYSRAREWFAKTYNSANDVIKMDDMDSGKIVGKALTQVYHTAMGMTFESGHINYTITLAFKDGRYKYEVTDFYHTGQMTMGGNRVPNHGPAEPWYSDLKAGGKGMNKANRKFYTYYLIQLDDKTKALIEDLKGAMNTKFTNASKDDW